MAPRLCLFLLIFLFAAPLAREFPRSLVIWSVGQGQWVTMIDSEGCWHFDVGGEFAPWPQVMALCRGRRNLVSLSHWDWDHVGLVGRARNFLPNICLLLPPQGTSSERKMKLLAGMPACADPIPFGFWNGSMEKTTNASSRVVLWRNVLLPGDSSRDQEKFWVRRLASLAGARILVLGHHGSATSTGKDLLATLAGLKMAVASARYRRYGHPHPRVRRDLEDRGVPLLRTEDWGTIRIEL